MNNNDERDYAEEAYNRSALDETTKGCLRCQYGSEVVFDHDADCPYRSIPMSELAYMDLGSTIGMDDP